MIYNVESILKIMEEVQCFLYKRHNFESKIFHRYYINAILRGFLITPKYD